MRLVAGGFGPFFMTARSRRRGLLNASFKVGRGERDRGGRHFTNLDETGLETLIARVPELALLETCNTQDGRSWREAERWLNALLRR